LGREEGKRRKGEEEKRRKGEGEAWSLWLTACGLRLEACG